MRKVLNAASLTLLLWSCLPIAISCGFVHCGQVSPIVPPAVMSNPQYLGPIAQISVEHSSVSDLVVDLGVGDPRKPVWSMNVWNREPGIGNLNLTVDISTAAQYLLPSEENRWFLRVFDAAIGNQGQIDKFTITSDNQTFDSTSIPVAIYDFQASYSYIPGVPLELAISRRISIRDFPQTENYTLPEVPSDMLSKVLWAGYGTSSFGRTTSSICGNYPLVIYVCNKTAVYKYNPDQQTLELFKGGDYRFSENPGEYPGQSYPGPGSHPAPVELFIVLNTSKFADIYWGAMEAGAIIQNIYLEANSLGLGTVCVGGVNATLAHDVLDLPTNEVVLYNMPLGYPTSSAFYNFTCSDSPRSAGLPTVRQSSVLLDSALAQARESHDWSEVSITPQESSQILWSGYGFSYLEDVRPSFVSSPVRHRTTACADGYPLEIWMMNSTGTYLYDPLVHDISVQSLDDKRAELAQSTAASWVASSPMTLLVVLNSDLIVPGRLDWAYTEIGSPIQNVLLESAAWGLVADWCRIVDENTTRAILGIAQQTDLHPIIAISVGHPVEYQNKVLRNGNSYLVTVSTNSTVTTFNFDGLTNTESFEVEGANGTVGFSNVTIPKSLLNGTFNVQVDGIPTYYSLIQNATHSTLYFTYNNTSNLIEISAVDNTPPHIYTPLQEPLPDNVSSSQDVKVFVNVTDLESGLREVILSYSVDSGVSWNNVTMQFNFTSGLYAGEIPGKPYSTMVQYKIVAYDNADNVAIEDNAGNYYTYPVISEFATWAFCCAVFFSATVVLMLMRRRRVITKEEPRRQRRRVQ